MTEPDATSLARLHDIVVPPPAPWWPPAPGWWALAALVALLGFLAGWRWHAHRRANAYRRQALAELDALGTALREPKKRAAASRGLAVLVRRAALSVFPRGQVTALVGQPWLAFLDRTGRTEAFTQGPGRLLADVAYAPDPPSEAAAVQLAGATRRWLRHHRAPPC